MEEVRQGRCSVKTQATLALRMAPLEQLGMEGSGIQPTLLFPTRSEADKVNKAKFALLQDAQLQVYTNEDWAPSTIPTNVANHFLSELHNGWQVCGHIRHKYGYTGLWKCGYLGVWVWVWGSEGMWVCVGLRLGMWV